MEDSVTDQMARELRHALQAAGLDPDNPPSDTKPPAARAFSEYKARGGDKYTDAQDFTDALVKRVAEIA